MPTLTTESGKPVDVTPVDADAVNAAFRDAMDSDGPEESAPPRRQPRAAAEDAPKPRRGRQPKAEKSRTTEKPAAAVKDDYSEDAQNFVGTVWTVAASLPPSQPFALVLETNADGLVGALAEGAKHNATIRAFVSTGQSAWWLQLAGVTLTMGMQAAQIARDPELREQAAATTREHLKAAMGAKGVFVGETDDVPAAA